MFFAVMKGIFMKKRYIVAGLAVVLFFSLAVKAEDSVITDYLADVDEMATARDTARDLLQKQPRKIEISLQKTEQQRLQPTADADETAAVDTEVTFAQAPFNLLWGASLEYMQHHLGWQVQKAEREGYDNVYQMQHHDYPQNNFTNVAAAFGKNNKLWCIFAQGQPLDDDATASVILQLFDKYYEALEKKYGNAEVHFEPYTYQVEQPLEQNGRPVLQNGRPVAQVVQMQNPLGGETFLQELQEGKANLYATFYNDEIGVTLGIFVDENAKSHLLLDYKNLPLLEKEEELKNQQKMEGL